MSCFRAEHTNQFNDRDIPFCTTETCEQAGGAAIGFKKTSQTVLVGKATRCVYTLRGSKYVKKAGKFVPLKKALADAKKKKK